MRAPALLLAAAFVGAESVAQTTSYCDASFNNSFRVVSGSTSPNTGRRLPVSGTTPTGYYNVGVAAGTRAWTWVPKERFQAGHDPFRRGTFLTVTGFSQTVYVGPEVLNFPTTTETYQFETGLAPAEANGTNYRHHSNSSLPDLIRIPQAPLSVTSAANYIYEHSFNLATPIPIQPTELVLFVTYRGGEMVSDPNGGQTLAADWNGGYALPGMQHWGFASPGNPRLISIVGTLVGPYRGKIGLITDEPVFVATGYHGNRYDSQARSGERMRGLSLIVCDWSGGSLGPGQQTLWFDFEGGQRYGTAFGFFTALFNMGSWFPVSIPYSYGNLLLDPADPNLFGFPSAGQTFQLGANGEYRTGISSPYTIPLFGPGALGMWVKFQGICANIDPINGISDIALTNSTSMKLVY